MKEPKYYPLFGYYYIHYLEDGENSTLMSYRVAKDYAKMFNGVVKLHSKSPSYVKMYHKLFREDLVWYIISCSIACVLCYAILTMV